MVNGPRRLSIPFSEREGDPKEVFWYLAETDELEVSLSHEHNNYLWLQFDEAEEQITFEQEKDLLRSARHHLRSSGRSL